MPTPQRAPKPAALPYPFIHLSAAHEFFWLAHWCADTARAEKLQAMYSSGSKKTRLHGDALWYAYDYTAEKARECLVYAQKSGHLLFAWAGSSVLKGLRA